jgi:hypothetical protein
MLETRFIAHVRLASFDLAQVRLREIAFVRELLLGEPDLRTQFGDARV